MKKNSVVGRVFGIIFTIILFLSTMFLLYEMISLNVLPTKILFLITIVFVLLDLIFFLLLVFYTKGVVSKIFCILLSILLSAASCFGGYYMMKTNGLFSSMTNVSLKAKNAVSVVVKDSSDIKKVNQLNGKQIGTLRSIGAAGTKACIKGLKSESVSIERKNYDSMSAMLEGFYNGEVEGVIINESSRSSITDMDGYSDFTKNTRVVYQTTYTQENTDKASSVNDITKNAFNVLISGSDTRGGFDEYGRSDVIMVATVNPKTSTVLLTSIPRDFYVTTACDAGDGCQEGALDKITHTGIHGTNTTKRTVENLLGITINYTFKVGFDTVTDLVDALDGIDVTVEEGYALDGTGNTNTGIVVHEGVNHLDGEHALLFARERYAYAEGDRQRTKNQQQVLMGIIKKGTSPTVITNYAKIMDAMANTFSTTMSSEEIQSLIKYQISDNPSWTIQQYMVDGTGDTLMCAELGDAAYVMVPNQSTVTTAKNKINAVLDGKSADDVNE